LLAKRNKFQPVGVYEVCGDDIDHIYIYDARPQAAWRIHTVNNTKCFDSSRMTVQIKSRDNGAIKQTADKATQHISEKNERYNMSRNGAQITAQYGFSAVESKPNKSNTYYPLPQTKKECLSIVQFDCAWCNLTAGYETARTMHYERLPFSSL